MENVNTTAIIDRAASMDIKLEGIENVPFIVQGRPLFDFVGVEEEVLTSLGQNDDDLFQAAGLFNIAVFPDGRVEGLKTVSSQYQVVQHMDAILAVFQSLPEEFDLKGITIGVSANGGKVFAKFDSGHTIEIKPGDDISYQLLVENSGDGSTRFSISGGAWRTICSNGLKIPDNRIEQIIQKKLHKGGLELEDEIKEFLETMTTSIDSMGAWKNYTKKKLATPDIDKIFQQLEVGPRTSEEILDLELRGDNNSVRNLLEHKDLSAWDLYNAFTQRITDSESAEKVKVERGEKVSQVFDKLVFN